jgi:hypothetical protein
MDQRPFAEFAFCWEASCAVRRGSDMHGVCNVYTFLYLGRVIPADFLLGSAYCQTPYQLLASRICLGVGVGLVFSIIFNASGD